MATVDAREAASPPVTCALHACLDALALVDPQGMSGTEQARLLTELTRAESRLAGLRLKVLAAAERARTAAKSGATDTGAWAAGLTHTDPVQTHRQVRLATGLGEVASGSAAVQAARAHADAGSAEWTVGAKAVSATQAALADGSISPEHTQVIVEAMKRLPGHLSPTERDVVEARLLDRARTLSPRALRRAAQRALAAVEPDPAVVDAHEDAALRDLETRARARTRLTLHDNDDGTVTGHFTIPTLPGRILARVLQAMTSPRRGRLGAPAAQVGDRFERTDHAHQLGAAFCELLEHLPTDRLHPATAATVIVTLTEQSLRGALTAAGLDTGETITAGQARRLLCGAGILPAVLSGTSQLLDLGRRDRYFNQRHRLALAAQGHTGCAAEGCERPLAWCELHHTEPWSQGGPTDLDHCQPLCGFHHHRVHDPAYHHRIRPDGAVTFHRRT